MIRTRVRTEKTRLVRYLLYLYFVPDGFGDDSHSRGTASRFLKQVESKTNQFEIVFKSIARFSTHFRVKERLKLLLAMKV